MLVKSVTLCVRFLYFLPLSILICCLKLHGKNCVALLSSILYTCISHELDVG